MPHRNDAETQGLQKRALLSSRSHVCRRTRLWRSLVAAAARAAYRPSAPVAAGRSFPTASPTRWRSSPPRRPTTSTISSCRTRSCMTCARFAMRSGRRSSTASWTRRTRAASRRSCCGITRSTISTTTRPNSAPARAARSISTTRSSGSGSRPTIARCSISRRAPTASC